LKQLKILQFLIAGSMILSSLAFAEDDESLDVFGYFQGVGQFTKDDGLLTKDRNSLTFKNQTLNIFLAKDLGEDFRALVNTEYLNNVNTSQGMGQIKLEEAWIGWQPSEHMRIRLGKQIPIFNSFNEIKNKMVLHPYMFRPIMYEASLENENLDLKSWAPREAYVQVDGNYYIEDHEFQYAFFWGNSDLIAKDFNAVDTSKYHSFGGRLGYANSEYGIKMGVSGTIDREAFVEVTTLKNVTIGEAALKAFSDTLPYVVSLRDQALSGLAKLNSGISQLEAGIVEANAGIVASNAGITAANAGITAATNGITAADAGLAGHATFDLQIAALDPTDPAFAPTVAGIEAARDAAIPNSAAELTVLKATAEAGLTEANTGLATANAGLAQANAGLTASTIGLATANTQLPEVLKQRAEAEAGLALAEAGLAELNQQTAAIEQLVEMEVPSARRYRIGFDFTWEAEFGTVFNSEYIKIFNYFDDDADEKVYNDMRTGVNSIASAIEQPMPMGGTDITRKSVYFSLGQKIGEQWFVYAKTSRLTNKQNMLTSTGVINYGFGLTYNPIFPVTFKAQYAFWGVQEDNEDFFTMVVDPISKGTRQLHAYFVGVSVMF
jgi:X-X-X-Leu-X-X-Gly heptad repeat protein